MYPRSGFRSGGTCECTLVPDLVPGEHPTLSWKPTLLATPKDGDSHGLFDFGFEGFLVLKHVNQFGVVDLKQHSGDFSGVHRARFNPVDGQLYVSGMAGWGTYTTQDGCLQRIRYTGGEETQLPIDFHIHENGIRVSFSQPVDHSVVVQTANHFAQAWNYRYSGAYGSPEYWHRQLGLRGHDVISIQSVTVLEGGREIFWEIAILSFVHI